jgi:hypothetical protein
VNTNLDIILKHVTVLKGKQLYVQWRAFQFPLQYYCPENFHANKSLYQIRSYSPSRQEILKYYVHKVRVLCIAILKLIRRLDHSSLLWCYFVSNGKQLRTFRRTVLPPYSELNSSLFLESFVLKMTARPSFVTSVIIYPPQHKRRRESAAMNLSMHYFVLYFKSWIIVFTDMAVK